MSDFFKEKNVYAKEWFVEHNFCPAVKNFVKRVYNGKILWYNEVAKRNQILKPYYKHARFFVKNAYALLLRAYIR